MNAPQCYVICTLPVLCVSRFIYSNISRTEALLEFKSIQTLQNVQKGLTEKHNKNYIKHSGFNIIADANIVYISQTKLLYSDTRKRARSVIKCCCQDKWKISTMHKRIDTYHHKTDTKVNQIRKHVTVDTRIAVFLS